MAPSETDLGTVLELCCQGRTVGRYTHRPELPQRLSPRPYLHPLLTLGGTVVTELMPEDHLHHLGVSLAVPDVEGRNFWGGRTFVRGRGPTELDNHGVQRHLGWERRAEDGFVERLSWTGPDGGELLREERSVGVLPLAGGRAWALDFGFALTNTSGRRLTVGSPATNGRPGAGYGGFFWRAPAPTGEEECSVRSATAEGEEAVHGSRSPWVALSGGGAGAGWTLVLCAADEETREDRWFVRVREYPGVGPALAWDDRLVVEAGARVVRRVVTAVADGRLDRAEAAELAAAALAVLPAGTGGEHG